MSDTVAGLLEALRAALAPEYEVERALGAGGMGAVFLARDRTLDRLVAVKVVAPELAASPALRERFLREARTIARLRHPNIVDVYTAGETGGLLYFIMQYVPGESLRDHLDREKRVSPARDRRDPSRSRRRARVRARARRRPSRHQAGERAHRS